MSDQTISYISPRILRDTSSGVQSIGVLDRMRELRELAVTGPIDRAMAFDVCQQLLDLEREDPAAEIRVYVSSPGGEVTAGLAIYDAMRQVSCPVRTICMDSAASMGAVIFMAGDERELFPHAELMIHDPLSPSGAGGSALGVQEMSRRLMGTRRTLNTILAERSGLTLAKVQRLTGKDTFLSAERACEHGFAHRILSDRKGNR